MNNARGQQRASQLYRAKVRQEFRRLNEELRWSRKESVSWKEAHALLLTAYQELKAGSKPKPVPRVYHTRIRCYRGHLLTPDNVRTRTVRGVPARLCRTCIRASNKKWRDSQPKVPRKKALVWAAGEAPPPLPPVSRKARCGHHLTPENSVVKRDKGRCSYVCRACYNAKGREGDEEIERCRGCGESWGEIRTAPMRLGYPVILCEECYQDRMDNPFYAAVDLPCDAG